MINVRQLARVIGGFALLAMPLYAAPRFVPQQYATIQAAIDASFSGDEIVVAPGTYAERITAGARLLTIRSSNGPSVTVLDGQDAGTVVTLTNAISGSVLRGFTIINGRGDAGAAGIPQAAGTEHGSPGRAGGLRANGNLLVRDCIFVNNVGGDGGAGADAAFADAGPPSSAGSGGTGGPGAASADVGVKFLECLFSNNRGGAGGNAGGGLIGVSGPGSAGLGGPGAILISGNALGIMQCRFAQNRGGRGGNGADSRADVNVAAQAGAGGVGGPGAVYFGGGVLTVGNCTVRECVGGAGGAGGNGVWPTGGVATNGASGGAAGAGVFSANGSTNVWANVTLVGNVGGDAGLGGAAGGSGASPGAAGAAGNGVARASGGVSIRNSILWANNAPQTGPSGISITYSCVEGGAAGPGIIAADPQLDGDLRQRITSPCIDAGSTFDLPADVLDLDGDLNTIEGTPFDLLGGPRQINVAVAPDTGIGPPPLPDMGAYEIPASLPVLPGDMNCDDRVDNFDIDPFVLALIDPSAYHAVFPACFIMAGDVDGSGAFDNFDIDPFVALLVNP